MKGGGTSVSPIFAGVRTDMEKVLEKFLEKATVRFGHFVACFQEAKLSMIYAGRNTENELREFAEKVLAVALSFCFPPYAYQAQVGGIYLLYSLYHLQTPKFRMKIRVTMPMVKFLMNLYTMLKSDAHFDACYILNRMITEDLFYICKFPDEHNPLTYRRFEGLDDAEKHSKTLGNGKSTLDELMEDPSLVQVAKVHEQYSRLKETLFSGGEPLPEPLALIKFDLRDYVYSAITDCEDKLERRFGKKKRRLDPNGGPPHKAKKNGIKESRSAIRERAYHAVSDVGRLQHRRAPRRAKAVVDRDHEDEEDIDNGLDELIDYD